MAAQENQLVGLLENMLLTPSSDFYISTVLFNPDGTAADPFTAKTVDLGTLKVNLGKNDDSDSALAIGIVLTGLLVKGLSNVQVIFDGNKPEITVDGNTVTFNAKLPNTQPGYTRPAAVPDQIEMSGGLDVTIDGTAMPPGTISITVKSVARVSASFVATEETSGKLSTANIDVTKITLAPGTQTGNITFDIKVDTVFSQTINEILNQSDTQNTLIDKVNGEINQPKILANLSRVATSKARAALGKM